MVRSDTLIGKALLKINTSQWAGSSTEWMPIKSTQDDSVVGSLLVSISKENMKSQNAIDERQQDSS